MKAASTSVERTAAASRIRRKRFQRLRWGSKNIWRSGINSFSSFYRAVSKAKRHSGNRQKRLTFTAPSKRPLEKTCPSHYSGSTIAASRNHRPQVAFSSRKSHLSRNHTGHMNCGTALGYSERAGRAKTRRTTYPIQLKSYER